MNGLPAVSLFSNCGAGDLGYARAGFEFVVVSEIDERRLHVASLNHKRARQVPGDLRHTWPEVVATSRKQLGDATPALLAACPPCQGMSSARSGRGCEDDPEAGTRDRRNLLVEVIANVAEALLPRIIVVENVRAFLTRLVNYSGSTEPLSAARLLVLRLRQDYRVFPFLTDLADYGVPQTRIRSFLTFVRRSEPGLGVLEQHRLVPYPMPTTPADSNSGHITLREALATLAANPLDASSPDRAQDNEDPMHAVPVWGHDRRYKMVSAMPPGSGGRAWENSECSRCGPVEVSRDCAICKRCNEPLNRPVVQNSDGSYRLVRGFRTSSYSRMRADVPAATVTTASGHIGSDRTIHPFENRVLSPRECAYLQTFPEDFEWGDALMRWGTTNVRAMIGEAVPPKFTELHGRALHDILTGARTMSLSEVDNPRAEKASRQLFGTEK